MHHNAFGGQAAPGLKLLVAAKGEGHKGRKRERKGKEREREGERGTGIEERGRVSVKGNLPPYIYGRP